MQDTGGKYKNKYFIFRDTLFGLSQSAKLPNMVALKFKSLFVDQFTIPVSLKRLSELLCQDLEQVRN